MAGSKRHRKGNLLITTYISEYSKLVQIEPKGFWTDVITVNQSRGFSPNPIWGKPTISWGSGGRDKSLDELTTTNNFIEGLEYAKQIYNEWKPKEKEGV
jgi:ABC-type glycerol-3-phosphate transport system substrate-binding protein